MDDSARVQLVREQAQRVSGKKRASSTTTMIVCPYHTEKTPSGRIRHDISDPRRVGRFNCFGCGVFRVWDEFAAENGLTPFSDKPEKHVSAKDFAPVDDRLLPDFEDDQSTALKPESYRLRPLNAMAAEYLGLPKQRWRGFSFEFLIKVGAKLMYHNAHGRYYLFLPVNIRGELAGYIKALPAKEEGRLSYLNAPGPWSLFSGLFPYDYTVRLLEELELSTIVLVEGPRDVLRLLRFGIPAMCILGTQSWSEEKIRLLEQTGAENIILCFDGDRAGKQATRLVYTGIRRNKTKDGHYNEARVAPGLHEIFSVTSFNLWDRTEPDSKLDPYEMPRDMLVELKAMLV